MSKVVLIRKAITLEQVRAEVAAQKERELAGGFHPGMVWYGAPSCWWTHSPDDLREAV